jgi:hypothetical protein
MKVRVERGSLIIVFTPSDTVTFFIGTVTAIDDTVLVLTPQKIVWDREKKAAKYSIDYGQCIHINKNYIMGWRYFSSDDEFLTADLFIDEEEAEAKDLDNGFSIKHKFQGGIIRGAGNIMDY